MANTYTVGTTVHLTMIVKDASGALTDAASCAVEITRPDGAVESFAATHDSTGTYHYDYLTSMIGWYHYRAYTANPFAADSDGFDVIA